MIPGLQFIRIIRVNTISTIEEPSTPITIVQNNTKLGLWVPLAYRSTLVVV